MTGPHRNISPFLQTLRNFLLGRKHTLGQRFQDLLAERTQPRPTIPGGPAHKLFNNNYFRRDIRRSVHPPVVVEGMTKEIEAKPAAKSRRKPNGNVKPGKKPIKVTDRAPGKVFRFD